MPDERELGEGTPPYDCLRHTKTNRIDKNHATHGNKLKSEKAFMGEKHFYGDFLRATPKILILLSQNLSYCGCEWGCFTFSSRTKQERKHSESNKSTSNTIKNAATRRKFQKITLRKQNPYFEVRKLKKFRKVKISKKTNTFFCLLTGERGKIGDFFEKSPIFLISPLATCEKCYRLFGDF